MPGVVKVLPAAIAKLIATADPAGEATLAISGASGAHKATKAEREALEASGGRAIRGFSTLTGHLKEAQFPFAIALAALAIRAGAGYPAFDAAVETEFAGKPGAVLATAVGFDRYEGAALAAVVFEVRLFGRPGANFEIETTLQRDERR